MADFGLVRAEYNQHATAYNDYASLPYGILETQLLASALGDCTGLVVLDLGGGTGLRARQVIDAGAKAVDVVDLSSEMMNIGKDIEASLGRGQINWYEANASKPLDNLSLRSYDLVMANWIFDHAHSVEALEGMWRNIGAYLKPGGRFVGVRSGVPTSAAITSGKYGTIYKDLEQIPGGFKFRCMISVNPPIEFEATSMEISYSGSKEMHEKVGLEDVQDVPYERAEIIRQDTEGFWDLFLDQPSMVVVKARKKAN